MNSSLTPSSSTSARVEHDLGRVPIRDGTDGEFRLVRCTQFAHERDIQRRVEPPGDLRGHRHAAARKGKDERRGEVHFRQPLGQQQASLVAVRKDHSPAHDEL